MACRTANESKSGAISAGTRTDCVVVMLFLPPVGRTDPHAALESTLKRQPDALIRGDMTAPEVRIWRTG